MDVCKLWFLSAYCVNVIGVGFCCWFFCFGGFWVGFLGGFGGAGGWGSIIYTLRSNWYVKCDPDAPSIWDRFLSVT